MKAEERLAAWLFSNEKNYKEGVLIFKELAVHPKMNQYFSVDKPDKMRAQLLQKRLFNYARVHNVKPGKPPELKPIIPKQGKVQIRGSQVPESLRQVIERPRIDKNPHVEYGKLPVPLQSLFDENGRLKNEQRSYHAELKAISDDENKQNRRSALAKAIVSNEDQIRGNWDKIDTWWAENQKPVDPVEQAKKEAIETDRRIKANLNYIRRFYGQEKQKNEVEKRMQELDKMGVVYDKLIAKSEK